MPMTWRPIEAWELRMLPICGQDGCKNPPAWIGIAGEFDGEVSSTFCDGCKTKVEKSEAARIELTRQAQELDMGY